MNHLETKIYEQIYPTGLWIVRTFDYLTGALVGEYKSKNLVTTIGKQLVARFLGGKVVSDGKPGLDGIQYVEVGIGSPVTPGIGDTQLVTPLDRTSVAASTLSGTTVTISGFFGRQQANGVITEGGLFGTGLVGATWKIATSTINTGLLFNHANLSITKTDQLTMTVQTIITVT